MARIVIKEGTIGIPVFVDLSGRKVMVGEIQVDIPEFETDTEDVDLDNAMQAEMVHSPDCDEYQTPIQTVHGIEEKW